MSCSLFADDTSIVKMSEEIDGGVGVVLSAMNIWKEESNDTKEVLLEFGTNVGGSVRVLGSWVSAEADVNNKIRKAKCLWWKVKTWLKSSRLTKKWQGRVIEACVGSCLLYDCQARVWYKRDNEKLQRWRDKCYRCVWSNRNG